MIQIATHTLSRASKVIVRERVQVDTMLSVINSHQRVSLKAVHTPWIQTLPPPLLPKWGKRMDLVVHIHKSKLVIDHKWTFDQRETVNLQSTWKIKQTSAELHIYMFTINNNSKSRQYTTSASCLWPCTGLCTQVSLTITDTDNSIKKKNQKCGQDIRAGLWS